MRLVKTNLLRQKLSVIIRGTRIEGPGLDQS